MEDVGTSKREGAGVMASLFVYKRKIVSRSFILFCRRMCHKIRFSVCSFSYAFKNDTVANTDKHNSEVITDLSD